jgi:GAF domain-containing protein
MQNVIKDESSRLEAMKYYLEQFPEAAGKLQDIVDLASHITGVPVAFITLMDKEIQWITVKRGYDVEQMPRATSFCTHTIEQDDILVVPDATLDERFKNIPLVTYPPSVRYYAGISLKNSEGHNVGTLCVLDVEPHNLTEEQLKPLKALSRQVTNILELNLSVDYLRKSVEQIEARNEALKKIAQVQSHDIREPLTSVMGIMNLMAEDENNNKEYLQHMQTAVKRLDGKIRSIVDMSATAHALP